MASSSNHEDEFDWEAAVAEIDDACKRVASATTLHGDAFPTLANNEKIIDRLSKPNIECHVSKLPQKTNKAVRQSTLDKFVGITEKCPEDHLSHYQNWTTNCENGARLYTTEGVKSDIDPVAAKTWTYPVNVPLRDYQFAIVKTALFSNTLVSLPTGLGKTLIAAVVMYNYFRWFPAGKIVFTAPSRPLVMQQIEACHNIVGIPQEWTIDMTGQMNPAQRSGFWQSKRIFFVTPQVLEKDIQSGSCVMKQLVCLVVDEAHRAMGNYSYCVVVREIMAVPVQLRILALTATPGSKQATIQTVIDNLHISTMEYRNESDPDVSQYTHNRNVELIPVAMSRDSIKVSNLLLEVIQPVVQKLCSLGVFYNRDIAKLTPFEFLTARDRFRQAPPASLAQPQYGEVEAYFGAAITLYHIYKLLFSHGIRPAFEMLQQKLQQGSFSRLMGRNETMWQVKLLMQQSLGHGAPNPKVVKMEEIIVNHFKSTDPGNSRVIVFTNFRESVKDIMESLAKLGDMVKAMEFIGQNSGKASKGQTQKVQQAVLQKFRAGGYNIIVATSIGEEGLDIMEVDLVICFDANVSPLRMIQRMGRTGRKRDGRVVILASEGSELQGYLKKQAKGKALGKHMHNGGINSFNFHASSRMVPHSYQPEVQFVEMSIEKFVPRGRKPKADIVTTDPGADQLTEHEKSLLQKYFDSSSADVWKPSLIAFPHYQLFPSRVYKVKHSFRTTEMLIDTLQFLQEQSTAGAKNCSFTSEVEVSSTGCSHGLLDTTKDLGHQGSIRKADSSGPLDSVPEQHDSLPCIPLTPLDQAMLDSQRSLGELNASSHRPCDGEESLPKHKSPSNEASMHKTSDGQIHDKDTVQNVSSTSKISLHRCLYNTGFVSVSPDGRVMISSPPSLPFLKKSSSDVAFMTRNDSAEASSEGLTSPSLEIVCPQRIGGTPHSSMEERVSPEVIKVSISPSDLIKTAVSSEQIKVSSPPSCNKKAISFDVEVAELQSPICSSRLFEKPEEVVLATPDSRFVSFPYDHKINMSPHLSNVDACYIDFSPRLTNLAKRGIVPESPIATVSKCNHSTAKSMQQPTSNQVATEARTYPKSPAFGIVASSWEEPLTYLREKGISINAANTTREICKTPGENQFAAPADVSVETVKSNNMNLKELSPFSEAGLQNSTLRSTFQNDAEKLNFECLSISKPIAAKETSTPLFDHASKSCSEDWQLSSAEVVKSIQKPRRFKRLCKFKDTGEGQSSATQTEIPRKNKTKPNTTDGRMCRKPRDLKGKQHLKTFAQPFIDEEAEVSSDEGVSADEDDANEDAGDGWESESDSFIDDRVEPTAAPTQSEGGHVDMMAIYRRSLFTQSPVHEELNPWDRFCRSRVSPGYTGSENSAASERTNVSGDTLVGSDSRFLTESSAPNTVHDSTIRTSRSGCLGSHNAVEELEKIDVDPSSSEERKSKIESRKRKLSFQRVDTTPRNLKPLENQACPSVGGNLRENSCKPLEPNESADGTFEDDLFEGLDLDALEAEAAEMVRSRSTFGPEQMTSTVCSGMPDTMNVDCFVNPGPILNNGTSIKQSTNLLSLQASDLPHRSNDHSTAADVKEKKWEAETDVDQDFLCSPSFDLGI